MKFDAAYPATLKALLTKKETMKAGIVKKFSANRVKKNNEKSRIINLRGKIGVVDEEISLLKQKNKKIN